MVHKKYIKRDGKIFGPYLYQNYRENGITKTRYLGIAKERKKMQVNFFWIIGIIILIVLLMTGGIFFLSIAAERDSGFVGELASKPPFDFLTKLFTTSSPVSVFVQIFSNTPPEFFTRPSEILVCENKAVNEILLVKDSAGDNLSFSFYPDLGIRLRFNPEKIRASGGWDEVNLWTRQLDFNDINRRRIPNNGWAIYPESISVEDGFSSDSFNTNLVIIEVNDAPEFDIGVQTINLYLKGENMNFYYDLGSELILNGEETPKQYLKYGLTYQNGLISPFNIGSLGVINIFGNESYILGGNFTNYPLRVCVNDTGLTGIGVNRILHTDIGKCLEDSPPQSAAPLGWCDEFILTITKQNRQPNITSYYPLNISSHINTNQSFNRSLKVNGNCILYFNLTAYDPDWTPLDVYWYVDNVSKEYYNYEGLEKNNVSKFEYSFGCEIFGNHLIKAVVTDGLLNDSVQWNISVNYVECPKPAPGGGGGGGGGGGKLYCQEKWECNEWVQCENLYELIGKGWPGKDVELLIEERCDVLNYTKEFCGFQNRICTDFNYCKTEFEKPPFIRECYYTENPNCTDGIKNCHDGSCEVLVDCGGFCSACPTCNDKIQNQGEVGVDCGGPCRVCIELPWLPIAFKSIVTYSLIALLIIVLLLVARQIIKYAKFKRVFGESRIKNVLIRGGEREDEDKKIKNIVMGLFFIFFVIVLLFFANAYIINFGQANRIISVVPGAGRAGFLASYGFMNSIFNNFGMFFLNTLPYFTTPSDTTILGYEDILLEYDFKNNVTDPDPEDNLTIQIEKINDGYNFQDYPWINITSDGVLIINSTKESETGNFKLSMKVLDSSNEGQVMSFYFNISPVNDAPQFVNLENQIFNEGDLFEYTIQVIDEENNVPFIFNIENNPLIDFWEYAFDEINGEITISFTPVNADIGNYLINFSVMDYNLLGNKTTSQLVNFIVTPALWNGSLVLDYLIIEDENKFINLTKHILPIYQENASFSYNLINSEFPSLNFSFNLITGIINVTPEDRDVGYNEIEIIATSQGISSFRIFNFTVLNIDDSVSVDGFTVNEKMNISGLELSVYENIVGAEINIYIKDDDFAIPFSQKDFYNESLTLDLIIEGPNPNLFKFIDSGMDSENIIEYSAEFDTGGGDTGEYNVTVNVADANNFSSVVLRFNLTVISMMYDTPNITFPNSSVEFNLKEGVTSNLVFRANHTIRDDLLYEFYIDNILRDSFLGSGNNTNVTWNFTPNFTDETYGNEMKNLTLIVSNRYYPNFFKTNIAWNLTINHTNCPPILIKEIQDKGPVSYPYEFGIDLMVYFYDADYYDIYYNNTPEGILKFDVISNSNDSKITERYSESNWVYIGAFGATVEQLNINVSDNQSSVLSNNFNVTFVPPQTVPVPTPSGGSSTTVPIALKIIVPGRISAYEGETIEIPLTLVNSGSKDFNDLNLNSSAFKNGSLFNEIKTSLDKTYFKTLKPKQEENLTLTVFFNKSKLGSYEILVQVTSKSPKYTDWGKIYVDLQAINESQVKELLIFTQELIAGNPQCIEITEILNEARDYFEKGDFVNAKEKTEQAINECKEAISQVSVPRLKISDFIKSLRLSSYLFLSIIGAVVLAIILGLIYYFIKRREISKLQKTVQESKREYTKV